MKRRNGGKQQGIQSASTGERIYIYTSYSAVSRKEEIFQRQARAEFVFEEKKRKEGKSPKFGKGGGVSCAFFFIIVASEFVIVCLFPS